MCSEPWMHDDEGEDDDGPGWSDDRTRIDSGCQMKAEQLNHLERNKGDIQTEKR